MGFKREKEVNSYMTEDKIRNTRELIELYNIIDEQVKTWGECLVRVIIKEVIDSDE